MLSGNSDDVLSNGLIECPYCICLFVSRFDLELHLKAFGTNKSEHVRALNNAHKLGDPSFRGSMAKGSNRAVKSDKSRFKRY